MKWYHGIILGLLIVDLFTTSAHLLKIEKKIDTIESELDRIIVKRMLDQLPKNQPEVLERP